MPTVRQSVTSAMRKARLLNQSDTSLKPVELNNGRGIVASMLVGWVNDGLFGPLTEVIATDDYEAKENERIRDGGFTITLPTEISADGGVRKPYDLSVVATTGATPTLKIYDATLDEWVSLLSLTNDSEVPLAARDPDGFACVLAMHYAEEFGKQLGPMTMRKAESFMDQLTAKFGAVRVTTVQADYF